jgi:hypothetical protein
LGDIYYENLEIYSNVLRPKEIRPHKRNYSTTQIDIDLQYNDMNSCKQIMKKAAA